MHQKRVEEGEDSFEKPRRIMYVSLTRSSVLIQQSVSTYDFLTRRARRRRRPSARGSSRWARPAACRVRPPA